MARSDSTEKWAAQTDRHTWHGPVTRSRLPRQYGRIGSPCSSLLACCGGQAWPDKTICLVHVWDFCPRHVCMILTQRLFKLVTFSRYCRAANASSGGASKGAGTAVQCGTAARGCPAGHLCGGIRCRMKTDQWPRCLRTLNN